MTPEQVAACRSNEKKTAEREAEKVVCRILGMEKFTKDDRRKCAVLWKVAVECFQHGRNYG